MKPTTGEIEELLRLFAQARDGRLAWLRKALADSGFLAVARLTGAEVAGLFGRSASSISRAGFPKNADGKTYNLRDVLAAREAGVRESAAPSDSKERKLKAEAEIKEMQAAQMRNELLPTADVVECFTVWATELRRAGEVAQQISVEAYQVYDDALASLERRIKRAIAGGGTSMENEQAETLLEFCIAVQGGQRAKKAARLERRAAYLERQRARRAAKYATKFHRKKSRGERRGNGKL